MRRIYILLIVLCLLLSGCDTTTTAVDDSPLDRSTTAATTAPTTPPAPTQPKPVFGWVTENQQTCYIKEDGTRHTGWLDLDGKRYYLNEDGILQTGWLQLDGKEYYLKIDGSITRGKATIDEKTYFFTSAGVNTLVVNPWNPMPEGYTPQLAEVGRKHKVDAVCLEPLLRMLADCEAAGFDPAICSSYREHEVQIELYDAKVEYFLKKGYSLALAKKEAGTIVAVPGTSEHELGLALDLVDNGNWDLDESQENTPAQKWLMEHCWEYGFILRYPTSKTASTGIIYEPWHYRYVGVELAMELRDSGMCLEEYFEFLS